MIIRIKISIGQKERSWDSPGKPVPPPPVHKKAQPVHQSKQRCFNPLIILCAGKRGQDLITRPARLSVIFSSSPVPTFDPDLPVISYNE